MELKERAMRQVLEPSELVSFSTEFDMVGLLFKVRLDLGTN
jgi:hypothetical protein